MADSDHIALLKKGVDAWNAWWREEENDYLTADLHGAILSGAILSGAILRRADLGRTNLFEADLSGADLNQAYLSGADFGRADLHGADLTGADLTGAILTGADLTGAILSGAHLRGAILTGAKLREADLSGAILTGAKLRKADLRGADLTLADLRGADLNEATLVGADLEAAQLVDTDFTGADLTSCRIFGISAWRLKLDGAKQQNLVIKPEDEPQITVDNIEVAQFIYLMLHNQKLRDVIDTITSKAVLILGRFTDERKAVLNALREELRKRNYLPILFDFEKPRSLGTDETITLLARMARFIIADISDAKSVLQELRAIVPDLPSVPVQPIIRVNQEEPGMFDFYRNRPSFLTVHRYADQEQLLADLGDKVIRPAELKVLELRG
ncbi:pentapeptide repeat-containing protein [Bradyrhizobium sp. YCK136]|uniref:pentapeptide repeat-containing protein n=1 Tax=Bradyrhizobium sp. YCK136 TaxID=3351346 RepID=UPI0037C767FC